MIVGVGEWGFRELPFEEHCRIAKKLGFKYMELGIGGEFKGRLQGGMSERELKLTLECIQEYGLKTPFMCIENDFTKGDAKEINKTVNRVCNEAKLAKAFGVTHLRLFAGFTPAEEMTEKKWRDMITAFKEVDSAIKKLGMVISIETHGVIHARGKGLVHVPTVSTDRDMLKRLLAELPESIGINFDPGNLKPVQSEEVITYLDFLNSRINYCHLKDWIQHDDGSWTAAGVGDGTMDWKPLLRKMAYKGVYLIEYEPTQDVEDGISRSLAYLKRILPGVVME